SQATVHAVSPAPVLLTVPEHTVDAEVIALLVCLSFSLPIPGLSLTVLPASRLPNAVRAYRRGMHGGFDLYCPFGTEVRALAAGTVTRSDSDFVEMSSALHRHLLSTCASLNITPPD